MIVRRALGVVAGLMLAVTLAVPAMAKSAPPRLGFKVGVAGTGDAGAMIPYSYSDKGLPAGAHMLLQRQLGTGHVWKTQAVLKGGSGAGKLKGLALGKYLLRVVAVDKHGKALSGVKRALTVYGTVDMEQLCLQAANYSSSVDIASGGCETGTATIGAHTLDYTFDLDAGADDMAEITVTHSTCRSITLRFGASSQTDYELPTDVVTATLRQSAADPVVVDAAVDSIGTVFSRVSGSWSIAVHHSEEITYGFPSKVFASGTMSCWSGTGV